MKEITLHNRGMVVMVDDGDYERLNVYRWLARRGKQTWYAARTAYSPKRTAYMHREILGTSPEQQVDHKDGNGLNNTRSNLRVVSPSQNQWNRRMAMCNTSGYKGVHRVKGGRWKVQIRHQYAYYYLGRYDDPVVAAKVYDRKARELYGVFAKTNFAEDQLNEIT